MSTPPGPSDQPPVAGAPPVTFHAAWDVQAFWLVLWGAAAALGGWTFRLTGWWAELNTAGQAEIADLVSGKKLALGALPPGLSTMQSAWSPDGEAFAYVANEAGQHALIVVRPATREVSRPYTTGQEIASLELSRRGRYAACKLRRSWRQHLRIVDVATGRFIRPHVATRFLDSLSVAWSPVGQVLAVERANTLIGAEFTSAVHFYDFPP